MGDASDDGDMELGSENNQTFPGGKQSVLPDDPSLTTGCTTSKDTEEPSNDTENKPTQNSRQPTITEHFKPTSNTRTESPKRQVSNTTDVGNKKQKSDGSDNDDDDRDDQNRRTGIQTRSKRFPRLSIEFDDSDDDGRSSSSRFSSWAKRDIADYRAGYPNASQNKRIDDNYKFYTNNLSSHPDGDCIDNIHKKWYGDYRRLEYHHGYIQWLFPIQEKGLNWSAEPLQKHEIEKIKGDPKALKRLLKSYKMMLDFYGFELANEETGDLRRSKEYEDRFNNLNTSSHNYLRITRILKCLGEFDYEYLKFPFLVAILREAITENKLPNCLRSCKDYWIETLRDAKQRREIRQYANELVKCRNDAKNPPPPPTITTTKPDKKSTE